MELTLTNIILAEVIFVLLVTIAFLLLWQQRLRKLYKRLLRAHQRLKRTIRVNPDAEPVLIKEPYDKNAAGDHSLEFFLQSNQEEAKRRYTALTQSKLPRLDPTQPYAAKVAALRYLYLSAESDLLRRNRSPHESWLRLERLLHDITRWVVDRKQKQQQARNNRVELLEQRLAILKKAEQENKDLRRKLYLSKVRQDKLGKEQLEQKQTIDKLRRINRKFQQSANGQEPPLRHLHQANQHLARSERQIEGIDQLAQSKHDSATRLLKELQLLTKQDPKASARYESIIRNLEADLRDSSHTLEKLRKQMQAAQHAVDARQENSESGGERDILSIVEGKLGEGHELLDYVHAWDQGKGHITTLSEIQHLRDNNQSQRGIIVDLETQLRKARKKLEQTDDEDEKAVYLKEVQRLEGIAKEYEYCIDTLESEVDQLQYQLNASAKHGHSAEATTGVKMKEDAITQLNYELDKITHKLHTTLHQHKADSVIRRYAVELLDLTNIESIARRLALVLRELELRSGFHIYSELGNASFFTARQFSNPEMILVKEKRIAEAVTYTNDGILFSQAFIQLLLKDPSRDGDVNALEVIVKALVGLTSGRVAYLQAQAQANHTSRDVSAWGHRVRELLSNLDIQHAYRTEEITRTLERLLNEVEALAGGLELGDASQAALNNALTEAREHMQRVFSESSALDVEYNRLHEQLDRMTPAP
ncbi:coiled-coil domain-containing protein [Marinimicrobium alkaliphilum]|uniref:hypothetical protein n=1 Tax=Marinimicrobium alkaliphilum TaxID=2202654 RepID=UPI000DB9C972|nr:hypothetical protein [Marinimicrobium alkaliphilum]